MVLYMEFKGKDPAPALARGLDVLDRLADGASRGLHDLAAETGVPKASLLRILETLCARRMVVRDEDGQYRGMCRMVSLAPGGLPSGPDIDRVLRALSRSTGETAEWYVRSEAGSLLVRQDEPQDRDIRIVARIGFLRRWVGEMDAVNTLAWSGDWPVNARRRGCWIYDMHFKRKPVSAAQIEDMTNKAAVQGWFCDAYQNPNRVSRAACGVYRGGRLAGILSVASFEGRDRSGSVNRFVPDLAQAAEKLGSTVKDHKNK